MSGPRPSVRAARARPGAARTRASRGGALRDDLLAGLINAVVSVPDGLASAALAGVNPVYGLYTSIAAPIGGSLLVSAQLMQIATTSASALAAGQVIGGDPSRGRDGGVFLLGGVVWGWVLLFWLLLGRRLVPFFSPSALAG